VLIRGCGVDHCFLHHDQTPSWAARAPGRIRGVTASGSDPDRGTTAVTSHPQRLTPRTGPMNPPDVRSCARNRLSQPSLQGIFRLPLSRLSGGRRCSLFGLTCSPARQSLPPDWRAASRRPPCPQIRVAGDSLTHPSVPKVTPSTRLRCFGPGNAAAGPAGLADRGVGAAAGRRVPARGFVDEHHRPTRCVRQPCSTYGGARRLRALPVGQRNV